MALVITIIVLMILAGVSLSFVLGDNGILKKAQETADAYKNARQSEQQTLQNIENYLYGENGGNNTGDNTTGGGNIPAGLKVGSTVSYAPIGTYNWQAQYYASVDKGTVSGNAFNNVTLDSSADYKISTWKVFEINKTSQKVTLVPAEYNGTGVVTLQGAQGYNNGVKLLNDACSNLYSTPSKGITARSIKIDDIENKMTASALASARGDRYLKQVSSAYSQEASYYPSIYAQEKLSVIDVTKRSTGLDISEQKTLIGRTDNGATEGHLQASSIQPYQTLWAGENADDNFLKTAFQTDSESNTNYYDLIRNDDYEHCNYWIASRFVGTEDECGVFGIWVSHGLGMYIFNMAYMSINPPASMYVDDEDSLALFPIVTVPANLIVPDGENFKVE